MRSYSFQILLKKESTMKIKTTMLLLFVSFIYSCKSINQENQSPKKPNIIIFYADDMGYGDLAIQNKDSKIPTPNLDKLAEEGLLMTDAHSSSGICSPSRYALLTGRHHWRDFHGIVNSMGPSVFVEGQTTLPSVLKTNGYYTAAIGKWHLGWNWEAIRKKDFQKKERLILRNNEIEIWPAQAYDWSKSIPDGPLSVGFDYYFGDGTINFPPYVWIENDRVTEIPTTTMQHPDGLTSEGNWELRPGPAIENWNLFDVLPTLTKKAISYIKSQKDAESPFFLYMSFPSPHAPIIPNEEFIGKSQAGPYGDFVYQTDWSVGQILKALDDIGAAENTIVIFTSDNGPEHYAYDRIENYNHNSSGSFRGLKRDVYEGGHHVPFIARWPKHIKAGTRSNAVFSQVDILNTLTKLIGGKLPKKLRHDSHDFSSHWLGDTITVRAATVQNTYDSKYALRMNNWLYINDKDGYHSKRPKWIDDAYRKTNDTIQLFNLKDDVGQKNNIAADHPEIVREMHEKLKRIMIKETFIED